MVESHIDFALANATDYLRADPDYDGGITGVMKIAHAAESIGMDVELHFVGPARRHCMVAMRNSNYYEMGLVHPKVGDISPPVYRDGYTDGLDSVDENGCVGVPEGTRFGRRVRLELYHEAPHRRSRVRVTGLLANVTCVSPPWPERRRCP